MVAAVFYKHQPFFFHFNEVPYVHKTPNNNKVRLGSACFSKTDPILIKQMLSLTLQMQVISFQNSLKLNWACV